MFPVEWCTTCLPDYISQRFHREDVRSWLQKPRHALRSTGRSLIAGSTLVEVPLTGLSSPADVRFERFQNGRNSLPRRRQQSSNHSDHDESGETESKHQHGSLRMNETMIQFSCSSTTQVEKRVDIRRDDQLTSVLSRHPLDNHSWRFIGWSRYNESAFQWWLSDAKPNHPTSSRQSLDEIRPSSYSG